MNKFENDHFSYLRCMCEHFMATHNYNEIVAFSGELQYGFKDDVPYPFKVSSYFKYFMPTAHNPMSWVCWRREAKPQLIVYHPESIWSAPATTDLGAWASLYELTIVTRLEDVKSLLGPASSRAFIGDKTTIASGWDLGDINPPKLLHQINWYRGYKSEYEQHCIRTANAIAVEGHAAAQQAFRAGASEFEIKMLFAERCMQVESELAYPSVVAQNTNAAILHYESHSKFRNDREFLKSLLIDAGATFNGYASDVTRTYTQKSCLFEELISGLNSTQMKIVDELTVCSTYAEFGQHAIRLLAELLCDFGLIKTAPETAIDLNIIPQFMPHGLGHFLGLQVHDPGTNYLNEFGKIYEPHSQFLTLKMGRDIEANQIVTVEPGIYFINKLLGPLQQGNYRKSINWQLVDQLRPYGGVRIEDNVLITTDGVENLTRNAFNDLYKTTKIELTQ